MNYTLYRYLFYKKYPSIFWISGIIGVFSFLFVGAPFFVHNLPILFVILSSILQGFLTGLISINIIPMLLWITTTKKKEDEDEM